MNLNTKKKILFVDDEPNFLDGLRRLMRNQSETWDMYFFSNPYAAFDQICKTGVDAVVSDIMMPCMDGFELLEKIRSTEWTKDIPVLILTGSNENHLKQRALDLGATDLLNKPVNREDIIARINSMLRLKAYQDEIVAQNALLERKVRERTQELEESRLDILWRLGKAAEYRDYETGNHIVRVGCYCRIIAETLGMKQEFVESLFLTSQLHDIGKIGIPDHILLKPGKLTTEEFEIMKRHCAIGVEILQQDYKGAESFLAWRDIRTPPVYEKRKGNGRSSNPFLEMASAISMTHHERWDGTGYPGSLAGDEIPVESRIVALADVFDALCSERPYKPAYPESESLTIIRNEVGKHFDPEVYAAFDKSIGEVRSIRMQLQDETPVPGWGAKEDKCVLPSPVVA
ncbi:MAG TPA: HD domain-containing phosphohydrolase [Candidatus Wunengus sp. YC60]|uniref:HD domain-containing phosphohydrolase n=1 Tax=Candidatus Wunengus sp. YC60 TaxID=3367697 RepID=UPI0040292907